MTHKAIIVLSGGLDSCVTTAIAHAEGYKLALLHLNYGQRTEARELQAFHDIADFYGISQRLVVDIGYLAAIGGSSLTDKSMAVEECHDMSQLGQAVPSTYVPFRNGNILSIAVSWAEVIHASDIFIGAVEEDSSGYPDCREVFYDKFNALLACGLPEGVHIHVSAPLIHLSKAQIVQRGIELGAPLHLTWSCYQGEAAACGICESCRLRLRGFEQAGAKDLIKYLA